MVDTQVVAFVTDRKPATVRSWAHRGLLTRRGTDRRGRALYDLHEVTDLLARLDKPSQERATLSGQPDDCAQKPVGHP